MNNKIAIIGAGPCGLAQLRAFKSAEEAGTDVPETVSYTHLTLPTTPYV